MNLGLVTTTDDTRVNAALQQIIEALEQCLGDGGYVRGYYLVGSYATGEAIPASDVDVLVLLRAAVTPQVEQQLAAVRAWWRTQGGLPLDVIVQDEPTVRRVGGVWFQTASRLLYGEDVRSSIPRKPVENHLRDLLHGVFPLLTRVRQAATTLTLPLTFPAPQLPFYGYTLRYTRPTEPPRDVGTKDLLNIVLAIAGALTLQQANAYVGSGRKGDIPKEYSRIVGDSWSSFVQDTYDSCRLRWGYAVPSDPGEQAHLDALCQRLLAWENHFLAHYCAFLHGELHHPDPSVVQHAAARLQQLHGTAATGH